MAANALANAKLGLGLWKSPKGEVGAAVDAALRSGYRLLDGAAAYGNEAEVGAALAGAISAGVVAREEVFVVSKLFNTHHVWKDDRSRPEAALRKTLLEEQLEEFRTEKTALQQDLTESLLGRLTPPSVRLAAQLETDPQVAEARRIAADVQRYEKMLEPDPKPLSVIEVVATKSASDRAAAEALVFPL